MVRYRMRRNHRCARRRPVRVDAAVDGHRLAPGDDQREVGDGVGDGGCPVGVDLATEPVEVAPTAHYTMGGVDVDFDFGAPPVINDERLIDNVQEAASTLFGSRVAHQISMPSMGGEDFAHYLEHIPGALIRVGTRSGRETAFPLHDANFDIDEAVLAPTAQLMASALMRHLQLSARGALG